MSWYLIFCLVYLWLLGALLFRETAILAKELSRGPGRRWALLFYALWPLTLPWTWLQALVLTMGDKRHWR